MTGADAGRKDWTTARLLRFVLGSYGTCCFGEGKREALGTSEILSVYSRFYSTVLGLFQLLVSSFSFTVASCLVLS